VKVSRSLYHILTLFWLVAIVLTVDLPGNTVNTGTLSQVYNLKFMFDALLGLWVGYLLYAEWGTTTYRTSRPVAKGDESIANFDVFGAKEHISCALLVLYGLGNGYLHFVENSGSTGIESLFSLFFQLFDVVIVVLSAVQFSHLKAGLIQQIKQNVTA